MEEIGEGKGYVSKRLRGRELNPSYGKKRQVAPNMYIRKMRDDKYSLYSVL